MTTTAGASVPADASSLFNQWTGARECWTLPNPVVPTAFILVPKSVLANNLVPARLPPYLPSTGLFGLTAANPMGVTFATEENVERNKGMEADLRDAVAAYGKNGGVWPSFAFDEDGYKEDGFLVACAKEEVLALARKHGQGAVFRYEVVDEDRGRVRRWTVPALMKREETSKLNDEVVQEVDVVMLKVMREA
ncbi:hypothetical protein HK101_002954 [Irineochytrium annulatum]|nr:hypothetical protein HK101_002954 [Irineochytrium annulatum]